MFLIAGIAGITYTDGELGYGKKLTEEMIRNEVSEMLSNITEAGPNVQINKFIAPVILSIL
jgi:hypothetical protein